MAKTATLSLAQIGTAACLLVVSLAGCQANPGAGSSAYKEGEVGNGDFLFACDDGVACLPYSGDATRFPSQIATGSTFGVRFVAKGDEGAIITGGESEYQGVTTQPVPPYVGKGPEGFAARPVVTGRLLVASRVMAHS